MSFGLRCFFLVFSLLFLCYVVQPECINEEGEETEEDRMDREYYVTHVTFPDKPCIWKGATLGALREGYECINLRYRLNEEQVATDRVSLPDADWDPEWVLSIARRVVWEKLKESLDSWSQVHCHLSHGVVFVMNAWTTSQCAQARYEYERCVNENLTPTECLGKAIMTPPWDST